MINKQRSRGFTLIELIIALSVIAILSTTGIVAFIGQRRAAALNNAASEFISALNQTKANAVAQVVPNGISTNCDEILAVSPLKSYTLIVDKPTSTYNLTMKTNNSSQCSVWQLPKKLSGDSNISLESSGVVEFKILTGGVDNTVVFKINGYGNAQKTITIDTLGNITVKDTVQP